MINGKRFRLYVERVLVPTLKPGDIVVMDNLTSHKAKAVDRAIRAVGAKLIFLPKYSQISIRSSRPSLISSTGSERPLLDPLTPYSTLSAKSYRPSPHRNAQIYFRNSGYRA
jgi:hypothetical protein